VDDGTGLTEALVGLPGLRVLEVTEIRRASSGRSGQWQWSAGWTLRSERYVP